MFKNVADMYAFFLKLEEVYNVLLWKFYFIIFNILFIVK